MTPEVETIGAPGALATYLRTHCMMRLAGHVRPIGGHYACLEDLVLREGAWYERVLTGGARQRPRECFRNALLVALEDRDMSYVEGYAESPSGMVVLHAWNVNPFGVVIDTTWASPGRGYLGIRFDTDEVDEYTDMRGVYGVLDDWQHDWPLLSRPFEGSLPFAPVAGESGV